MAVKRSTVRAGDYIHQIVIEVNEAVEPDEDWQSDFTADAAYEPQDSRPQGAEFELALKRQSENRALFRIRYRAGIEEDVDFVAKHRIIFRGRTWNIMRAFDRTGLRIELHIEATTIS